MKNLLLNRALICILSLLIAGCSKEDNLPEIQEEILTATVDGEPYRIENSNSFIECRKHLTEYGSINLSVKASTAEGKTVEFLILNYRGANIYLIGNRTYLNENSFVNGNWINYSEALQQEVWSTTRNEYVSNGAFIEIINDNGNFLSGNFSFRAQNMVGESIRTISDGNFSVAIDR